MIGTDVARAASLLQQGKLVGIPTETVYGLAANALNPEAVAEIYRVKNRPTFNPLILHCASIEQAKKYISVWPSLADKLAQTFWPGSMSVLLPKSSLVPDIITAGSDMVVVRVPNHPLTLSLLQSLDFPLAAPSANISNTVSPTTALHVESTIGNEIDYVLDGGRCHIGLESTIVAIQDSSVVLLREGGITREDISGIGLAVRRNTNKEIQSPGQLKKHYATSKKLLVVNSINEWLSKNKNDNAIALLYEHKPVDCPFLLLSNNYNLSEIATNLFYTMREADKSDVDVILIEHVKQEGIGRAIADRLNRAATT